VSIADCRVTRSTNGILIEARAMNYTSRPIAKLFVIMTTEAQSTMGNEALYELKGRLIPGIWTTLYGSESRERAQMGARPPIDVLVAPVRSCFVQGVEYPDGSRLILYNPL